ncbi:MAG: ribonuclease HI family protein [Nitrospirota bacterium]
MESLSKGLSIGKLLAEYPALDKETLSALLLEAAHALGPAEVAPRKAPAKAVKAGRAVRIYTDGASRGNPGQAGAGVVIEDENGYILRRVARYLGRATNNQAEYEALLTGLSEAAELGASEVSVFADSELLIKQMKGEYRVKNAELKEKFDTARRALEAFGKVSFRHIPREKNAEADALANEAIDKRFK